MKTIPEYIKEFEEEYLKRLYEEGIIYASGDEVKSFLTNALTQQRREEKEAWLNGERCSTCGGEMKPKPLTNTCPKCWEEE